MKNLFQLFCFSLLFAACNSEKQQEPKDFIEIDMIPAIEGEAKEVPLQERDRKQGCLHNQSYQALC